MALGTKNKTTPEVGDLLFAKAANQVYYKSASLEADTVKIVRADRQIGQILFISSLVKDGPEGGTWITLKEVNTGATVYVPQDDTLYEVQANPEYAYEKKSGWNWQGILTGISTAINSALGIFNNAKKTATPIGEGQTDAEKKAAEKPTLLEWVKSNILLIIALPLVVVLGIILVKFVFKKQPNNQVPQQQQPTGLGRLFKRKRK